jgi:catechol 2,3-dioxygenase-like lactoylglutathione lyase family enzyme
VRRLFLAAAACALATLSVGAQNPGLVVGSGNFFSPVVGNLEKAVAFYRDGLGLDAPGEPSNADTNPALRNMFGLPDAQIRWQIARPPAMRTGVEIVEIDKAPRRPAVRRIQDPGAATLIVLVRDVDAALARAKGAGASVITPGGAPVAVTPGRSRGVLVADLDGHFIELLQLDPLPETTAPDTAGVVGVRVRLTVDNVPAALNLYQQALGLHLGKIAFAADPGTRTMLGVAKGQISVATAEVPGTRLLVEFMEFKDVDRRSVSANIQDPGSTRMQLQVRDLEAAIVALKKTGGIVVSAGGGTVGLPGRGGAVTRTAIVRDPNNLFLVLIETRPNP